MESIILQNGLIRIEIGDDSRILDTVRFIRCKVFCDEEGFPENMIETPMDSNGIHLSISCGSQPAACFTIIPPEFIADYAKELNIPEKYIGSSALSTKLAILPEFRKKNFAPLMVACWEKYLFAPRNYRFAIAVLRGRHCLNQHFYEKLVGFYKVAESEIQGERHIIMVMDRQSQKTRDIIHDILDRCLEKFLNTVQ